MAKKKKKKITEEEQEENNKQLKKMVKMLTKREVAQVEAEKYGKRIGKNIARKYEGKDHQKEEKAGLSTDIASDVLAEILYQTYKKDQDCDCGELLTQWTQEKFWGKVALDHLEEFRNIWQYLHDNKRDKKNAICYGDIDGSIWVEYPRQEDEWEDKRKIVIHKSHCSCADDRTTIFILDEGIIDTKFHVRTVWDRQIKKRWKTIPSLNTYRKNNFKLKYSDGRDVGYSLSLKTFGYPKVDWAYNYQSRIRHSLYLINLMRDITEDVDGYEC